MRGRLNQSGLKGPQEGAYLNKTETSFTKINNTILLEDGKTLLLHTMSSYSCHKMAFDLPGIALGSGAPIIE